MLATFKGSTEFGISTAGDTMAAGVDLDYMATESCDLQPESTAICSVLVSGSAQGEQTKTSSTITYTGAEASDKWFEVAITGGVQKLRDGLATCTAEADNAAPAATGIVDLYKVVVVPGAAAILAAGAAVL